MGSRCIFKKLDILPSQVAVICPTKNRHNQLSMLLRSLAEQTIEIGQILIADGGDDAEYLVKKFKNLLSVEYLKCPSAGQISQRNFALGFLNEKIKIVIYFDDDIQLNADAIEKLLYFWNSMSTTPIGISFNITNMPIPKNNLFRRIFCSSTEPRGKILTSGYNTPITDINENIVSDWLLGGATAWDIKILKTFTNTDIKSRWAICEDILFSYPLSRYGQMYVCESAKVKHIDDEPVESFNSIYFKATNSIFWRYYFVSNNKNLSKFAFFWMIIGQTSGRFFNLLMGNLKELGYVIGNLVALFTCLKIMILSGEIKKHLK